jgi:hypothetical protein
MFIIRAWLEEGSAEPLRAQITLTNDVENGIEHAVTVTQSDEVSSLVTAWIREVTEHEARAR